MPVKRAAPGPADKQKRTRFASPSPAAESSGSLEADDALLEEDLPEGAQNAKARSRKQIKDTGGYGSDSSNDEEGVVPSRRPKTLEDDEDVDMFADDVEEKADKKGKGKEKEFMDLNDVEGQEFSRRDEEDSGSEEEEEMDEKAQRKRGIEKDLGIEVTPFNMKGEMEEGRFTADGEAYIANDRDEGEKHDVWLDDVDKDEIKKARRAHRERERLEQERQERESGGGKEGAEERKNKEIELMREALELMERGETVLEALQRLGKEAEDKRKKEEAGSKKKSWAERQKERKAAMAVDQAATDPTHTSNPFTNLSNIVSGLTAIGHLDVYSLSRESLQRMLPAPATNGSANGQRTATASAPPTDTRQFQYRFSLPYVRSLPEAQRPVEREVFGPFSVQQLNGWRMTGFFGSPACENVEVRLIRGQRDVGDWGSWQDVVGA